MLVAGVMSGTSGDGIDVALVELSGRFPHLKLRFRGHFHLGYPGAVRKAVLAAMNAPAARVADLARLNVVLGELYADAVRKAGAKLSARPVRLIGCHGQTLYHQGEPAAYLGKRVAATWQTGEAAVLSARTGIPVVSDFRPADLAQGGQGAPLVPFLDYVLFRHPRRGRVVQNLGGIANLTAIPAGASIGKVLAFDTGPGNMVIDALAERLYRQPYDEAGRIAAVGAVHDDILRDFLRSSFFRQGPPKTAGREQFGREFAERFQRRMSGAKRQDVVATATALTARSIAEALRRFVLHPGHSYRDYIVSGGGTRNRTLMRMLAAEVEPLGLSLRLSDELGLPSQAKEAAAFALLAYQTWHHQPSNLPSATGASKPAVLGKITYAS